MGSLQTIFPATCNLLTLFDQGMNWHGSSMQDAWGTVDALYDILGRRDEWQDWAIAPKSKVLLIGHSNGGQGAWHIAARFPDRVIGGKCV